jgi:heme exporter protein C
MIRTDRILLGLCGLTTVALFIVVFLVIPNEKTMGFVQKIFYLHVPCNIAAFIAFAVTAVLSGRYLRSRDPHHDRIAAASAEVGLVLVSLGLVTGMLWARPVWGIYWTWDLRLTTTFVLWLIFLAYAILRRSVSDPDRRGVLSAVVGLAAFLDVPVVYLANRVKASQHPAPVLAGGEDSGLAPEFRYTLFLGMAVMLLHYVLLVRARINAARLEDEIEELAIGTPTEG